MEAFYSSLTGKGISAEDYERGRNVWGKMGFKTMREYHDMYCRVDVLQLSDIMEYQRERLMATHGLDILHSFALPSFSWRAALKFTGQELELISDRPMYDFIQRAKHGGISTITHRYARANNPYMGRIRGKMPKEIMNELRQRTKNESQFSMEMVCEYFPDFSKRDIKDLRRRMSIGEVFNPQEATTYLQYLDANNLYGWATSQPLPVGGFEWMTGEELGLPIGEMPPCFIEVDLEFPVELQDKFAELVPASENITPEGSNVQKLAQNLLPKKGYMCHIKNLTLYIELGVKLVKVRKGVKFEEKPWLKSYIDMNTELRAAATNDADKDMYKLLRERTTAS